MYEQYFKLQDRPFLVAPLSTRYFPGRSIEQAHATLSRCIDRGEGAACIIGPPGTGKTLLCQILAEEFANRFSVALLGGRLSSRQALFQAILYELRLPYRNMDEGELRLALLDELEPTTDGHEGLLLIVDEAHTLPWRLMEEVRLITNLVRCGQPRVRVVLAGGPLLEERFASPKLSSFSQRLSARCYLEPFDSAETAAYVKSQIAAVGGDPELFDDKALRSVYRATDGMARLINQVCDHALILASLGGVRRLSSEAIDEAWADLQQLPAPWSSAAPPEPANTIIEFGRLDEAHDEPSIPFRAASLRPLDIVDADDPLEAIAGQTASVERQFSPAKATDTEIELEFPEFGDPFSEKFAEEEVVIERFRNPAEIFARAPRVTSTEGRQIGPLLSPWLSAPPLSLAGQESWSQPDTNQYLLAAPPAALAPLTAPRGVELNSLVPADAQPTMTSVQMGSTRDAAVVVIEEPAPDIPCATQPERKPAARKGEFRSLFARLRRG